ncbi:MAG: hypothetical protein NC102_06055 [Clostridium sp.]|nr:hypothetical protein [Clostridium sp.]
MMNKETCQLFIVFPEHKDLDKTSPCIKEFTLLYPDEVRDYIEFLDRMRERGRAEHYLLYYDSKNIENFLFPMRELRENYPNMETALLNSIHYFADDWRVEAIQDDSVEYKLYQIPVEDDSFCEICERQYQAEIASCDSTYAIINYNALDKQSKAVMNRGAYSIDILILEAAIEDIEIWLQNNRRPAREYNWNKKHGESGKGAFKEHKNDSVAKLYCTIEHATKLLHRALGEDNEVGPLYAWDEECNRYMEFKRESKHSNKFHSYHLEEGDRKILKIKKILDR